MSAQAETHIVIPTTLRDAISVKREMKEQELRGALAERNGFAITGARGYLTVLEGATTALGMVEPAFARGALALYASHYQTRLMDTHPRTWEHHEEIAAERRAAQWLLWLLA
jgi:hypothetical protein